MPNPIDNKFNKEIAITILSANDNRTPIPAEGLVPSLFNRFKAEHEAFKTMQDTQRSTLENEASRSKAYIKQVESNEFSIILSKHNSDLKVIPLKEKANKYLHNLLASLDQDVSEEYQYLYERLLPFIRENLEGLNIIRKAYIEERKEKYDTHLKNEASKLFDIYSQDINKILLELTNKFKHVNNLDFYMSQIKRQLRDVVKSQILSGVSIIRGLFHEELLACETYNKTLTASTAPNTTNNENRSVLPQHSVTNNEYAHSIPTRPFASVITSEREKLAQSSQNPIL